MPIDPLTGALITGGLSFASGIFGGESKSRAADRAAQAQERANMAAIEEQRRQFDISKEILDPYVQAGTGALGTPTGNMPSAGSAMRDPREYMPKMPTVPFTMNEPPRQRGGRVRHLMKTKIKRQWAQYNEAKKANEEANKEAKAWNKKREAEIKKYDRWKKKQAKAAPTPAPQRKRTVKARMSESQPLPSDAPNVVTPTAEYAAMTPEQRAIQRDGGLIGTYQAPQSYLPTGGLQQTAYNLGEEQDLTRQIGGGLIGNIPQWGAPQFQNPAIPGFQNPMMQGSPAPEPQYGLVPRTVRGLV